MSQTDAPGSLQACALRIARCASDGSTPAGANNGYVTKAFARVGRRPEYEPGQEFLQHNACGDLEINYRDRDVPKRENLELELIVPDPEIEELLTGTALITGVPGQRVVTDGVTTTATTTVTSATAAFNTGDIGKRIVGTGIPVGARIASINSASSVEISVAATGSGSGVSLTINGIIVVADGATTSASTTVTSATANFTSDDVGKAISGAGIPVGATIASVTNVTTIILSAAATATAASVSLTITPISRSIGVEGLSLGVVPADYGVSLEVWTKAIIGGVQASVNPWFHWAFPRTFWSRGDSSLENNPMTQVFTGFAVENPSWGNGPWNDWRSPSPSPYTLSKAWGRFRSNDIPTIATGYTAVPAQV